MKWKRADQVEEDNSLLDIDVSVVLTIKMCSFSAVFHSRRNIGPSHEYLQYRAFGFSNLHRVISCLGGKERQTHVSVV